MRFIQIDAGPDGHRQARIIGKPTGFALLLLAAFVFGLTALLICWLMPLPRI